MGELPTGRGGKPPSLGAVDPRLTSAVNDTEAQNREGRDKVEKGGDKTDKYTKGISALQDEGARNLKSTGSAMPAMPTVPQAAPPAPPPPAPAAPFTPPPNLVAPSGLSTIDPALLAALVAATQERIAEGAVPSLDGDPASASSATTPQNPQPLPLDQVSLAKHPGGPMSEAQTAAVIDQALTINGVPNDPELRAKWHELYQHMAIGESSRDPNAYNNEDSNATGPILADGAHANSSRGTWQTIPTTFAAYHMAGTSNSIYDPVASAAASMNYVMHNYHVTPTGQGLEAFMARQGVGTASYQGY